MDVRIGIAQSSQVIEISLEEDTDRETLRAQIDKTLAAGEGVLWLTDRKGKETAISASRVAFVELGSADSGHRIGFGA